MIWHDVGARARGLATRLIGRRSLEGLAGAADLAELAFDLDRAGVPPGAPAGAATAALLERAVRRVAADRLRIIARWCGERAAALAAVFEDEDRRSLRAFVRGAVAGAPAEERLSGTIPTPGLPERALEELAAAPGPGEVAALLAALGSPYGEPIREEARRAHPDLYAVEAALARRFAERAVPAARRGGREVIAFAEETVDLENARAALLLAAEPADTDPKACFVPGGRRLAREAFLAAAASKEAGGSAKRLSEVFAGTPFAEPLGRAGDLARTERELLQARVRSWVRVARGDPLGAAPVLAYLLRLRAEAADLRRIIWGVALGAPRETIVKDLVSAA